MDPTHAQRKTENYSVKLEIVTAPGQVFELKYSQVAETSVGRITGCNILQEARLNVSHDITLGRRLPGAVQGPGAALQLSAAEENWAWVCCLAPGVPAL